MNSLLQYRAMAVCSVSMLLALQARTQPVDAPDTLALRALNRAFSIIPIELSIDMSLGQLKDGVPTLKGLAAGYDYAVYGHYQQGDAVSYSLAFRRDSAGGNFGGYLTRRARAEKIEVRFSTNDGTRASTFLARFRDATKTLGEPLYCDRDTIVYDKYNTLMITMSALWQRGIVTVILDMNISATEYHGPYPEYASRFFAGYDASRKNDTFIRFKNPTRHDSACFFTDQEIRDRSAPLDSATYGAWLARLRAAPP